MRRRAFISLKERKISIETCPTLSLVLQPHLSAIDQKLSQFSDFDEFWADINQHVEREPSYRGELVRSGVLVSRGETLPTYYATVLQDIGLLGWDRVVFLSPDLRQLHFKARFGDIGVYLALAMGEVDIPTQYPALPPKLAVEMPNFSGRDISLPSVLKVGESWFKYLLEELRERFWEVADELDAQTTVLEPQPILRSHCHRRIALPAHCSLEIEIDPVHPRAIPIFRLYGPNRRVQPLKANLEKNLSNWDHTLSPKVNLERALEISFRDPVAVGPNYNPNQECGICYSYRPLSQPQVSKGASNHSVAQTPTLVCDNPSCNNVYHHSCLFESIKSLPSSRRSYKMWFGSCPYCNE
ncbi:hypothetical protein L0F63_005393, partial [Massospora cicadina]